MECTPDEIYDELRELWQTAEVIADNIAEVASAIQFFTNNLFDEQHNSELTESVQALSVYLHRVAAAANEEATGEVKRATTIVEKTVNSVLQQQAGPKNTPQEEEKEGDGLLASICVEAADDLNSGQLPALPEMFVWRLQGLVLFLQTEAKKLAACDRHGQEEVWEWWEHHFEPVRDALSQLEFLEEQAVADGMSLLPYIEQFGGVPASVLADQWPEEMVAAVEEFEQDEKTTTEAKTGGFYSSEENEGNAFATRQQDMFGEELGEGQPEAAVVVAEQQETNGSAARNVLSNAEPIDHASQVDRAEASNHAASIETDEVPPVSESQESQVESNNALDSSPNAGRQRQEPRSIAEATLPLSEAIHETYAYEDRVAYAKYCLLEEDTDHRDFDTCFEMFDGEFVVARLIQLARTDAELTVKIQQYEWKEKADADFAGFLELSFEELIEQARSAVEARVSELPAPEKVLPIEAAENAASLETDAAESRPYTFEDWKKFHLRIEAGDLTAAQLKSQFQQMIAYEQSIIETLIKNHNAKQLKNWCLQWGRHHQSTKQANAQTIYEAMLGTFALDQTISFRPLDGETYSDAVKQAVEAITEEDIAQVAASRQAETAVHEKAITVPETVDQWRFYVRHHGGYQNLTPEQKIAFERANADETRAMRADRKQKTISKLELDEDLSFSIKEGYHDKKEKPLWIVQLSNRVERKTYKHLKEKAKALGGWFSSFKAEDTGFQFYDEAAAKLFTDLLDGDVDNGAANEARKIRKLENASERFFAVADTLEKNCQEVLTADETKLKNTVRRADMAAGMREDAQRGLATVRTLRALAEQLASGKINYLDGVHAATQLTTITKLLHNGKYNRIRHELDAMREGDRSGYKSHLRHEAMLEEPLCAEDIAHAEYPYPYIYKGHLEDAFAKLGDTPGVKRVTRRMQKLLKKADPENDSVAFRNSAAVDVLADFLGRAKAAGYQCHWFDCCMEDYNRLQAANIHNVFELRAAMRELLPYVAHPEEDDPVVKAEQELIGKKLPGFFPTPLPVILEMLELADIQGTDRVLESSAGKGDIMDAIRQAHPDVDLKGIEYNRTLRDVLIAKGYDQTVEFGDFLEHEGAYEKIIQNPPFERGADIEHVRHAFELLAPGGRLVSVMGEGPFFRSDSKSQAFREWLDEHDADVEKLPEDSFQGVEAFRQTGVSTRLVVMNKADS